MVYCFEPALRPLLGNNFANNPTRKIPTRIVMSVISTVVFVIANRSFGRVQRLGDQNFQITVSYESYRTL